MPGSLLACAGCGKPLVRGARFCMSCGQAITGTVSGGEPAATMGGLTEAERQLQLQQLLVEATLGEFEILGELGRGGMATVYLAHDMALDRKVAIKVIAPALLTSPGAAERFKREARTAAALSHPHIIPIHAVRETPQLLYFVMKFVEGRALDDILRERGPLPIRMVQTILSEVGQALSYAHRRGIVHRDIKPANVMLDGEGWAVVTDFGIAKVLESDALTVSGAMIGTPYYMSPEQCAGKPVSGSSDQYSLGVVAYEMLTGRPPFSGDTIMEIMKGHFFEPPPPVELERPDCPTELAAVVGRMLAKEPEARWASMEEALVAMASAPLASDDPIRGEMIQLARSSEALRRISRLSVPVSPVPAGWPRGKAASATVAEQGEIEEEAEEGQPSRWRGPLRVTALVVVLAAVGAGAALLSRPRSDFPAAPAPTPPPVDSQVSTPPAAIRTAAEPAATPASPPVENAESIQAARDSARAALARLEERRRVDQMLYIADLERLLNADWKARGVESEDVGADERVRYLVTIGPNGSRIENRALDRGRLDGLVWDWLEENHQLFPRLPGSMKSPLRVQLTFTPTRVTVAAN